MWAKMVLFLCLESGLNRLELQTFICTLKYKIQNWSKEGKI